MAMLLTPKAVNQISIQARQPADRQAEVQADGIAGGKTAPEMMLFPYIRQPANRQRLMAVVWEEVGKRIKLFPSKS